MNCAIECVKWILFCFNILWVLLGAAILGVGIYVTGSIGDLERTSDVVSSPAAIGFIVFGAIVFVIAFFGCCGAVRENHCMVVTYAVFLLTILIIQVAFGIWAFVLVNDIKIDEIKSDLTKSYTTIFDKYWTSDDDRQIIDTVQSTFSCCGIKGASDFKNTTIPWSCCGTDSSAACYSTTAFATGCITKVLDVFNQALTVIGDVAIGVAGIELVAIVFALCLANSISNDHRRGYDRFYTGKKKM